jgi:hypothetical protein
LRAIGHLLTGNGEGVFVAFGADKLGKLGRAGDIGAFANVDEVRFWADD